MIQVPPQGSSPINIPSYNSFCLNESETEKVYHCIEKDCLVNPMMFHKHFNFPPTIERPELKALKEFLDEGNPIINPYEAALLYQLQEESEIPTEIDQYYPKTKT